LAFKVLIFLHTNQASPINIYQQQQQQPQQPQQHRKQATVSELNMAAAAARANSSPSTGQVLDTKVNVGPGSPGITISSGSGVWTALPVHSEPGVTVSSTSSGGSGSGRSSQTIQQLTAAAAAANQQTQQQQVPSQPIRLYTSK